MKKFPDPNINHIIYVVINHKNIIYRLFIFVAFTNSVRHAHLERIAEADEQEVVKDFQVKASFIVQRFNFF